MLKPLRVQGHQWMFITGIQIFFGDVNMVLKWPVFASPLGHNELIKMFEFRLKFHWSLFIKTYWQKVGIVIVMNWSRKSDKLLLDLNVEKNQQNDRHANLYTYVGKSMLQMCS